jgi:hypothetical protein
LSQGWSLRVHFDGTEEWLDPEQTRKEHEESHKRHREWLKSEEHLNQLKEMREHGLKLIGPIRDQKIQRYNQVSLLAYQKGIRGGSLTLRGTRLKPQDLVIVHFNNEIEYFDWGNVTTETHEAAFWWLQAHDPNDEEEDEGDFEVV